MSNRRHIPVYRLHKQSGQAIVTLTDGLGNRRDVLLGKHGTPESKAEYASVIARWLADGRRLARPADVGLSVAELILAYWPTVETYYRDPDGRPTSEVNNVRLALRRLRLLFGLTPAADFDSLSLEALREKMIADGLCRGRINRDVARVKRLFKWAASRKLVPLSTHQSLQTVEGLRAGRSAAKERPPVQAVPEAFVRATLPFLTPQVAAMVELQLLTGMRPGEVCAMRTMDLETGGKLWAYRPGSDRGPAGRHKTAYRGRSRVVLIGPKAQEVLRPWLRLNLSEYLFQPHEARARWEAAKRAARKTPVPPSQLCRRKARPRKAPGECYRVASYDHAVTRAVLAANTANACDPCKKLSPEERCGACKAAAVRHWHPHQLRHTKATEIRREAGLDAARAVLGHSTPVVTEVYAEVDMHKAAEVMARLG